MAGNAKKIAKLKAEAMAAAQAGKHKRALERYQELAEEDPDDPNWAQRAGDNARKVGERQTAIRHYAAAAEAYARQGFLIKAIALCKTILDIDPQHTDTQAVLAKLNQAQAVARGGPAGAGGAGGAVAVAPVAALPVGRPPPVRPTPAKPMAAVRPVVAPPPQVPPPPQAPPPPRSRPQAIEIEAEPAELHIEPTALEASVDDIEPMARSRTIEVDADALGDEAELASLLAEAEATVTAPSPPPSPSPSPFRPPPVARPAGPPPLGSGPPPRGARMTTTFSVTRTGDSINKRPATMSGTINVPSVPLTMPGTPAATRAARPRTTIPAGAPLAAVQLGSLVPGSRDATELASEGGGVVEISLDDDDFSGLLEGDATAVSAPELPPPAPAATPQIHDESHHKAAIAAEVALPKTPLFSALDSGSLQRMIETCQLLELAAGAVVFRQGDTGDRLYVVASGEVVVTRMIQHKPDGGEVPPPIEVSRMGEGAFFGEVGLLTDTPRSATVTAVVDTTLLVIDRDVIGDLVEERPGVLKVLLEFLRERLIDELVDTAPLFAPFSGDERLSLSRRFKFVEVEAERTLIKQGERAPGLFILLCGKVTVEREGQGRLAELVPGDLVGEMSLLARNPAMASVITHGKSYLLALPAANFQELIVTYPQFLIFVSDLAEERKKRFEGPGDGGGGDYEDFHLDLL